MTDQSDWTHALERARRFAPFLARSLDRLPDLEALLASADGEAALAFAHARGEHEDVGVALRRERLALATALAIGDLARQSHALVFLFQLSDPVSPLVRKSGKASAVGPAGGRRPLRPPPWAIRRLGPLPR